MVLYDNLKLNATCRIKPQINLGIEGIFAILCSFLLESMLDLWTTFTNILEQHHARDKKLVSGIDSL